MQSNEHNGGAISKHGKAVLFLWVLLGVLVVVSVARICVQPTEKPDIPPEDMTSITNIASEEPLYILLIGSDSRKGTALYTGKPQEHAQLDQHSDIMTLMRVDVSTHTITLVSVPRDTVLSGTTSRINDTLLSGNPQDTVDAVERLTGVTIDYYMMTTFTSYEDLVDAIGGVHADVPLTITVKDPLTAKNITVKSGQNQLLGGPEALTLARARHEYGDNQEALRQINVRNLEREMMKTVAGMGQEDIRRMISELRETTTTDMPDSLILSLAFEFALNRDNVTLYAGTGPYRGQNRDLDNEWVVPEDSETWSKVMEVVNDGGDPTTVVPLPSFPAA